MKNEKNRQRYVIANWKMKLGLAESLKLADDFKGKFKGFCKNKVVVCPDFISFSDISKKLKKTNINTGTQDVFWHSKGSYTGEVSPKVIEEAGGNYVIIGHSERKEYLQETYDVINSKVKEVIKNSKLTPVVCIGEKMETRKKGKVKSELSKQLKKTFENVKITGNRQVFIAYEPIWAIGSGKSIKTKDLEEVNKIIEQNLLNIFGTKKEANNFIKLYGGSVDSKNVKELSGVNGLDGLLVGGASLKVAEFYKVVNLF